MIQDYEKLRIPDANKKHDFFADVNWTKNPKIQGCKVVRFTFPDGTHAYVKVEHLHAILFAIGNSEAQQKLVPQTLHRVRQLEGLFKVKAKRAIKKGEEVVFPYKLSVPEPEEMVIQDIKRKIAREGADSLFR